MPPKWKKKLAYAKKEEKKYGEYAVVWLEVQFFEVILRVAHGRTMTTERTIWCLSFTA